MTDVGSILLAMQLMALVDVINDPVFWQNGGWNQPIPAVPKTFNTLMQRDSIVTITWTLAALQRNGFTREAFLTNEAALGNAFRIWIDFVLLRVVGGVAFAQVTQTDIDVIDIARQCWFTGLLVCTCRYIYSQYNR